MIKAYWSVKDKMSNTHIILIESERSNMYTLYVDETIIGKFKTSIFFNSEYRFEIFEKKCSIVKLLGNKTPKLVVDGAYQDDTNKTYTPIPEPTWFAYTNLIINFLAFLFSSIYLLINFSNDNLIKCIYMICIFVTANVAIEYVSTAPMNVKNSKIRAVFRNVVIIIITILNFTYLYGFLK